jgi:hypothetical protein
MSIRLNWTNVDVDESTQPTSRSSHGVTAVGDVLYVFGGEHIARSVDIKNGDPNSSVEH